MSKLHDVPMQIDIKASKSSVWEAVFTQFSEVNNFNPLIIASRHAAGPIGEVGEERICELSPGNEVREKITSAVHEKELTINILEGGLPMIKEVSATFKIEALSPNRTRVHLVFHVSTKPAFMIHIMKSKMKDQFFNMLVGLKYHLETGRIVNNDEIKGLRTQYDKNMRSKTANESFAIA